MGKKLLFLVFLTFAFFLLNPISGFGQSCSDKPTASIAGTATICTGNSATITFTATPLTTVTYRINSGTNQTINIGSSGSNTLSATNLTTTTTFSLVSVQYTSGNCNPQTPTGSAIVTVNPNPTITGILAVCAGSNTQLSGSATPAATNPWISSNTSIATVNSSGLVTGIASGSSTITYTNSNGCQITAIVTVNALPTITGTLAVCAGSTTQLGGSATPAATNPWVSSNASVATVNSSGLVTGIASGTSTITYTNNNGCKITAIVTVNALPTISGTLAVCAGLTTQLNGSATPAASIPWISSNTSVATVSSSGLVTGIASGSSTITYTNNNGCKITAIVTVNTLPTITGTLTVCASSTTQLNGSATPAASNPWISSNTSVATVSSSGLVTGVASGTSTITYTNSNGCQITAIVTVNALPTITGTLAVCAGLTTQLSGSATPAVSNPWISSNTSVVTVSSSGLVTGVASGTSTITYTNSNGCKITATVTVNALPTITGTLAVCAGSTTQLGGSATPAATDPWISSNTSVATVSSSGLVTGVDIGTSTITYTNNNGCKITAIVTVNALPTISGTLAVCAGSTTQLSGSATPAATNSWVSSNTSVASVSSSGLVTGVASGTSTITYTNSNGCQITAIVTINTTSTVSAGNDQTICSNSTATMAGSFGGSATSASWKSSGSGSFNNNSTTAIYTPSNADINAGTVTLTYTTIDQSGICSPVESSMILTIKKAVEINSQPSNTAICASYSANLNVVASGDGLTYQWYKGTIGSGVAIVNSSNITGASSNILNFKQASIDDAGPYYAIVSGASPCAAITTDQVSLQVDQNIAITTQPIAQTVCENATNLSFIVAANAGSDPLTYQWRKDGVNITDATTASYIIPTATLATAGNYDVVITGSSGYTCPSIQSAVASLIVNPTPNVVATNSAQTICSGSAITTMAFSGNIASTVYNWTRDNSGTVTGIGDSGTGNISGSLTNTSNAPVTLTFTITPTANSCPGTPITATVIVNPKPNAVATNSVQTICSGGTITTIGSSGNVASTTFNWVRDNTGTVTGIGASGSGDINGSLTNTTSAPVTVTFTITPTANSCPGTPITATVLVNPTPNVVATNSAQTICSGSTIAGMVLSGNVATTAFNWTRNNPSVTGIAASGSGNITGSLTNTTNEPVTVTFTITPTANSCIGSPITATVLVNPKPNVVATNSAQTICSGSAITSIALSGNAASTTFNWVRDNTGTVTGIGASGSGDINGSLTNTTNAPVTVTFTITPTANSCPGAPITATVIVNPTPTAVATNSAQTICSGSAIAGIVLSGNVATTAFNWTRNNPSVTGIAASGSGNITGILTNTTTAPVMVTFTITPTANSCTGSPITATVIVNPTPTAVATNSAQTICSGNAITSIALSGNVPSSTFSWTRDNTTSVTGIPNGTGNNITGSLTNTTNAPVTVTFTIIPTANSCPGLPITATVLVNPTPNVTQPSSQVVCNNAPTSIINFITTNTGGTSTYSWTNTNPSIGLASTGTGNIPSFTAINSGTSPVTATIVVTPTFNNGSINCSGSTKTFTIIVNPDSTISLSSPPSSDTCINNVMIPIRYAIGGGGTGASITAGALPSGLTGVYSAGFFTISGTPTVNGTFNYTVTTSGACSNVALSGVIKVDPRPVGGQLLFAGLNKPTYLVCHNATSGNSRAIVLSGQAGTVVNWQKTDTPSNPNSWTDIPNTQNTYSYSGYSGLTKTTLYRAVISSGSCGITYSKFAVISVIPADIKPNPVESSLSEICIGTAVQLTSQVNYSTNTEIAEGGDFNNANPAGWLVDNCGNCLPANGDATKPGPWAETNGPKNFNGTTYDSPDKKFAIVRGNFNSIMQTPVFNTLGLSTATLKFNQAYVLTAGAQAIIELSLDGGASYNVTLSTILGAANSGNHSGLNPTSIDLQSYVGQTNLRIRFRYIGNTNSSWALDSIAIPDRPLSVASVWSYTNAQGQVITINNQQNITVTPDKIGLNTFKITSFLKTDDGTECRSADPNNSETVNVYVFDKYTSIATTSPSTCGQNEFQLSATLSAQNQGNNLSFPTADGYSAPYWKVNGPAGFSFKNPGIGNTSDPTKNSNAIFVAPNEGTYILSWTIERNVNDGRSAASCPPVVTTATVVVKNCIAMDFDGVDDFVDLGDYTGTYSIEAWIRPEAATGTIISTKNREINMSDLPAGIVPNTRWYHIAVDSSGKLYVDGIDTGKTITAAGTDRSFIGAKWSAPNATNHFSGWIEEVRIWNGNVTQDQIKFLMNQRLQPGANIGVEIPMTAPGLAYTSLAGYYQLLADPAKILNGGYTIDLANSAVNGKLRNMTTFQENTAPLPYTSATDNVWSNRNTWTQSVVWDFPNSVGIVKDLNDNNARPVNYKTPIDWNIVRTSHNISSGGKDITVLGLKSEVVDKKLTIESPGFTGLPENNPGQMIRVTHYLKLDGNMDLVGESQLLQDQGSILEETSKGWLERDQQGQANSFIYNYWSSPVSKTGDLTNNAPYSILDVMKYGSDSNSPTDFTFVNGPFSADDAALNSSTYWFWRFHGLADDYDSWIYIGDDLGGKKLNAGEAHTMKGVNGGMSKDATQNYVYKGKPHNGDITLTINPDENYLIGNPYPSALNGREFILDNIANGEGRNSTNNFNGTIYFWDHFETTNHNLREYIGGYAILNLIGGVPAASIDERIDNSVPYSGRSNKKIPNHYIPIGQGFFISTVHDAVSDTLINNMGGDFTFKNSQRIYKRENSDDESIFLKPEIVVKASKEDATNKVEDKIEIIRLSFLSPKGYNRQILVGAHPATTNGFDIGYDAPMLDYNIEDMYWLQGGEFLVIQGVPDFGKEQVLPIGIRIEKAGEFKIKIDTLENMNADHTIYLKDKVLDTIHDLRSGPYTSTSEPGEITDRFQLIFYKETKPDPDPIEGDPVVDEPVDPIIIDDLTEISLLHSYTENEMMVLNPKELEISAIYLFDMNGKLLEVFDEIPSEKEIRLKVNNFSDGIYVLKMHTDTEIITRKIVIKK